MKSAQVAAVIVTLMAHLASANAAGCVPQRQPLTLQLADFASPAEIVTPPAGQNAHGVAILFAGSDVADLDGAVIGRDDKIVSRPLRQVADRLACAGIASLRYNKRYVTGPMTVDRDKFDRLTGKDLAEDGQTALAFVRARTRLAKVPVVLIGWSEGTTVAMAVSAAEPSVQAVVLIAPVIDSPAKVAQQQYSRIGRPYLERYATDGALDADAIARAERGPGGVLAHIFVRMFKGFRPGETVNPLLDTNGDARISFVEADPIIASWYADTLESGLSMSASGRALPGVAAALGPRTPQLLMLQGMSDSMVDPTRAILFSQTPAVQGQVTLKVYRGLGHALGPAPSALEDELLPMSSEPLDDIVDWVNSALSKKTSIGSP